MTLVPINNRICSRPIGLRLFYLKSGDNIKTITITRLGLLTALMLMLGFVERQFAIVPGVPGIKLGLSNTVLLYALYLMNTKSAWLLLILKVTLNSLLFSGPIALFYSAAGGILSLSVMMLLMHFKSFGIIGVSVCGAFFHTIGQLLISRPLIGTWAALVQAPILIAASVLTGILTGIIAGSVCKALSKTDFLN